MDIHALTSLNDCASLSLTKTAIIISDNWSGRAYTDFKRSIGLGWWSIGFQPQVLDQFWGAVRSFGESKGDSRNVKIYANNMPVLMYLYSYLTFNP